ncbi:MAG: hypothetical protein ACKVHU_08680, partial [Acidimicrobiales bacterium]
HRCWRPDRGSEKSGGSSSASNRRASLAPRPQKGSPIGRLAPLRSIDIDIDIDTARLIALIDGSEIGAALTAAFSAR